MNAGHDESMLDAVAVYALGALPEAEAREVAAHIAACAECAREYSELRGVANLAGYGAETAENQPTQLQSARMKNAILREIRGETPKASATAPAAPAPPAAMLARPRAPWLAYLAAAACLAVAFLSTFQLSNVRAQHEKDVAEISLLADAVAPGAQQFRVKDGIVARSNGRIIIALQNLPALPKGKVYQAWTLHRGAKSVAPSITFTPDASGRVILALPEDAAGLAAVAMSVEPEGGSKAPTSTPAFIRPLT